MKCRARTYLAIALGFGVLGCAGGGGSSGGSGPAVVIGGAEGQVADQLLKRLGFISGSGNGDLSGASLIVLDGDHTTASMLDSMNGLKAAVDRGVPIMMVDAPEELKAAFSKNVGSPVSTGGLSLATAYRKISNGDSSHFRIWEIPGGTDRVEATTFKNENGIIVGGGTETSEIERIATPQDVDQLLHGISNLGEVRHPAPQPPAGSKSFFAEVEVIDSKTYAQMQNQSSSRNIHYSLMGILADRYPSGKTQYLIVSTDAQMNTGPQTGTGQSSSGLLTYGWFQDELDFKTSLSPTSEFDEPVDPLTFANFYNGKTDNGFLMFFEDKQGHHWPWYYHDVASVNMEKWNSTNLAGGLSIENDLYQSEPYDRQRKNYQDVWYPFDVGAMIKPIAQDSYNGKWVYLSDYYQLHTPITGRLRVDYSTTKYFSKVGAQWFVGNVWIPVTAGAVTITNGSPEFTIVDFGEIAPDLVARKNNERNTRK